MQAFIDGDIVRLVKVEPAKGGPTLVIPVREVPPDTGPLKRNNKLGIEHTSNFAVVLWGHETFSFTPTQARVVAALVTAANRGFLWLDQQTLLAEAQSAGDRLVPIFAGHPAWNRWIVSATPISERPATFMLSQAI